MTRSWCPSGREHIPPAFRRSDPTERVCVYRSLPTRCVDRAQKSAVEIIDDERDVHEANIAGPKVHIPFTLGRREIFQQFDLVPADALTTASLISAPSLQ